MFKSCITNLRPGRNPGLLHPIEKRAIPFNTLHLDHQGPSVKSKNKNNQVLTMVNVFTKFCILVKDTMSKWVMG